MRPTATPAFPLVLIWASLAIADGPATTLGARLAGEDPAGLAREARESGDPIRGALVFFRPSLQCARCHAADAQGRPPTLGPELAAIGRPASDRHVVESILEPSKEIRKGFEAVTLATRDGRTVVGLLAEERADAILVRDLGRDGATVAIPRDQVEERKAGATSPMPAGLVEQLADRREFLDLVRYVLEVEDGGQARATALRPLESALAPAPLPAYETRVDHAALIDSAGPEGFRRGEQIYRRVCANCHGTADRPGSLPNSPRFASATLKNGSDPYRMYQTLTLGHGQMVAQSWMVPQQKYDVIHYIREAYFKPSNPSQYTRIDATYLARLPKGDTRGPSPASLDPWVSMDYGPTLALTAEVGADASNIAYKGVAVRLDPGAGGVSRGQSWALFEHDTLRMAANWAGPGFVDWAGINFDGQHGVHPRIVGTPNLDNPDAPGWADPQADRADDPRPTGRDGRRHGPLPRGWGHYRGMYRHGDRAIFSYTVGESEVLESPGFEPGPSPTFARSFAIGPRPKPLTLNVARGPAGVGVRTIAEGGSTAAYLAPDPGSPRVAAANRFDGASHVEVVPPADLDLARGAHTVVVRFRTSKDGCLFAETNRPGRWAPGGKALFVRDGRVVFDIGWEGYAATRRKVDNGSWTIAALAYDPDSGQVRVYVDGRLDGEAKLGPGPSPADRVFRIGFGAPDFPERASHFVGEIAEVQFYQGVFRPSEVAGLDPTGPHKDRLLARWKPDEAKSGVVKDESGHGLDATFVLDDSAKAQPRGDAIVAGISPGLDGAIWSNSSLGDLRLTIPAGAGPVRFTLNAARVADATAAKALAPALVRGPAPDLASMTRGGPSRWPVVLTARATFGNDDGPFAVDVLAHPESDPWNCRMRFSGLDFYPEGGSLAVCTWDGDVWRVDGLDDPSGRLAWRRVASGLFQPLGLKVVDGVVHVSCRDAIVALRDLDGDGEADFYESFNSDHQVTEHFHEFAMDLQTDAEGNFYYAKAARHGLPAVVPQHGTLLKVARDGSKTEILATGFRAPNGVCLNPDGSFFSTDQEGFWLPKNRINRVVKGGFYGNIWGYTDVTDPADSAMAPPVCWITNAMDRSPGEPVWVNAKKWGALNGSLLNLSYGMGKVFVVPHETVGGVMQGGVVELPGATFPTGVMRGRFRPADGQLYLAGMFAWAGNKEQPGGFYRLRATGKPAYVPIGLHARKDSLEITFAAPLDRNSVEPSRFALSSWTLRRSANYGSKHYDTKAVPVESATLSADGRTVALRIPGLGPMQCLEIDYDLKGSNGEPASGKVHGTIHRVGE